MKLSQKEFRKLQNEWDQKLKESGFVDIEPRLRNGDSPMFTSYAPGVNGKKITESEYNETTDFYYKADELLNTTEWKNEIDKLVWKGFTEGKSYRAIISTLPKKISIGTCSGIVNKYKKEILL